jgi:thiamine pyrophosphate-dependent acetolactate synthase large subunit-like protein
MAAICSTETTHVKPDDETTLGKIAKAVTRAKKIIIITGAGISTNAGIDVSAHLSLFPLNAH